MLEIGIVICCAFAFVSLVQIGFFVEFVRLFTRDSLPRLADDKLPKTAILVPLRGADPKLRETLIRLLRQDYPRFEIHVVVDNPNDPAYSIANQVLAEQGPTNMYVRWIENRRTTCGLQCSALYEAMEHVDDDVEIIVGIDGDVLTHPTWLRELVEPFNDESVGVTHGNRWFTPSEITWGGLVRYLWNAAAVPPMHMFGIPWGGTIAIRASALRDSGLLENWSRAMVHDAPTKNAVKKLGLKVKFVPTLMMAIREKCSLSFAHDFIKRQMMWTRTYHPNWSPVFVHALLSSALWITAIAVTVISLVTSQTEAAMLAGGAMVGYLICLLLLLGGLEFVVSRSIARREGAETKWVSLRVILQVPPAILLTQFVYLSAVLLAHFRRRVTWRGVTYRINRPFDVAIESDSPFTEQAIEQDANVSL
jgi:cellulose synthase/poly-beta-1,6-N-acetylglucosamine synthase-like glycosyltransferase